MDVAPIIDLSQLALFWESKRVNFRLFVGSLHSPLSHVVVKRALAWPSGHGQVLICTRKRATLLTDNALVVVVVSNGSFF